MRGETCPRGAASYLSGIYYRAQLLPRYKVAQGRELSHSERVDVVVPTFPKATVAVGYEGHMLSEGDEVELPEPEGTRLVEAGVLEEPVKKSRKRTRK